MKVLFLTIGQIPTLDEQSVHIDLIKALKAAGHEVSVLCTREKRLGLDTEFVTEYGVRILRLRIGNLTRCSTVEKGINTIRIEGQFRRAIAAYYGKDSFDLVIYNTPPITLAGAVKYCKKKFGCVAYLMLKDIFPQNAVDLGMMSVSGVTGLLYRMFRHKERQLYAVSDRIGCMSQANRRYLLEHNPDLRQEDTEIFPNAVFTADGRQSRDKDPERLARIGVPTDRMTFIYGGNLGKPQGTDFLIRALRACADKLCNFIVIGSGTEQKKVYQALADVPNVYTPDYLPYEEYENLCAACDAGLIMLDYRFTIPNYPSRALSYLENAMPILACTDRATDIKELVEEQAQCGKWCYSDDVDAFCNTVDWMILHIDQLPEMGRRGRAYFERNFTTDICVEKLEKFVKEKRERK